MAKVSSKRQITLPVELCNLANIHSGDDVEAFVDRQGIISVVKKVPGAASGLLKDITINNEFTEQESLESSISS